MRIIVIGNFRYEMYAPAFSSAFTSMGHTVHEIRYENYLLKGESSLISFLNKFQSKYFYGFPLLKYNRDIIKAVNGFKPDFVFLYRCDHIFNRTLKRIRKQTIVISYNNDNPFSLRVCSLFKGKFISNAKYCDLVYVYRKCNIDDFAKIGVYHTKVLLPYYLTNRNYPIDGSKRDIPVAFVGHWEDDGRDKLLLRMKAAGIPVAIYGADYWLTKSQYSEQLKEIYRGLRMGEEYNKLLNHIQIALVFYSRVNKDTYTRRCFEIPATKTLMMAPYTEDMSRLFPQGEGIVYYHSQEEIVDMCKDLLANPRLIKDMAEKGYQRLKVIGGSEKDRCKEIITDVEIIKQKI